MKSNVFVEQNINILNWIMTLPYRLNPGLYGEEIVHQSPININLG